MWDIENQYKPHSISFKIELEEEIEDQNPEQRCLRDTVGLMSEADSLIPETQGIVTYDDTDKTQ